MNPTNFIEEKWDYLIILDACRYDYFESMYADYIKGELSKRISAGSSTNQWRDANFQGKYDDIVYISGNPHLSENTSVYDYIAGEHFHKVYDVWRYNWSQGTVLPEDINKTAIQSLGKHPGKRFIIHYMQPHAPYLVLGDDAKGYAQCQGDAGRCLAGENDYKNAPEYKKKMLKWLLKLFTWNNILGNHPDWMLRKWLKLPARAPMEYVLQHYDNIALRNAYKENIRIVLQHVAELLKYLSGRIIITSDHGDLLGEGRCYSHPPKSVHRILLEVPWLVIDKKHKDVLQPDADNQPAERPDDAEMSQCEDADEQMKAKLRDLGYM
ncbi:MAG: sulfatase-like hydrolase/transferase [Planctomycetes bacterium]|nr:sulfatase-like hydrolase/transferase [Planctomycetota bacterium]